MRDPLRIAVANANLVEIVNMYTRPQVTLPDH